ncbi:type III secretion system chaperone [Pseudovibrio ascidiaceicola]|uniref:type III secretion system chaperone n=1 Tax=Pseudovibrio ascidiaceicola TaxID=285279 RepID=UPI001AD90637|nr:type III secretion system chaperone [Pseudovibrio ascidiaceicola]
MFSLNFSGCLDKLWRKLGLGAPIFSDQNTASMNVDGVQLVFSDALDGGGIEVTTVIGSLSETVGTRGRQIEDILHLNLACLSQFRTLAVLRKADDGAEELVLSVSFRGYTELEKLTGLVEELLSVVSLYQPLVSADAGGYQGNPLLGAAQTSLSDELDGAMVFHL